MEFDQIVERLEIRMNRLISFLPEKRRLFFEELEKRFKSRAILLYGPRGVGKTTFLLIMAKKHNLLYVPGDDPLLSQRSFYDLAQTILMNYPGIIIDEVHFLRDWDITVKALYDSFPNKIIWISDSSSAVLRKGVADLSRRFVMIKLPLMSLREYIYFETGKVLKKLNSPFKDLLNYAADITRQIDVLSYFRD